MTRDEVIKGLQSMARQSDDAALAAEKVVAVFRPMFDEAFGGANPDHKRALELRYNALDQADEAKRMRREADFLRGAVALLEDKPNAE